MYCLVQTRVISALESICRPVDLLKGEIEDEVSVSQENVVLPDIPEVGCNSCQDIHLAPRLSTDLLRGQGVGGEQSHPAGVPGQIPVLPGTQMVQQGLIPGTAG